MIDATQPECPFDINATEVSTSTILIEWRDPWDPDLSHLTLELNREVCAIIPKGLGRWRLLELRGNERYYICLFPIDRLGNMNRSCECIEVMTQGEMFAQPEMNVTGSEEWEEISSEIPECDMTLPPAQEEAPISLGQAIVGQDSSVEPAGKEEANSGRMDSEKSEGIPIISPHQLAGIAIAASAAYLLLRR